MVDFLCAAMTQYGCSAIFDFVNPLLIFRYLVYWNYVVQNKYVNIIAPILMVNQRSVCEKPYKHSHE